MTASAAPLASNVIPFPGGRERWVDSETVCDYLSVSERTLRRYRDERALPCRKLSGGIGYRYRLSEVDAWIEAQQGQVS